MRWFTSEPGPPQFVGSRTGEEEQEEEQEKEQEDRNTLRVAMLGEAEDATWTSMPDDWRR